MPPVTRTDRALRVTDAAAALPDLIRAARLIEATVGADHPETLAAWATVEAHGATIHRQARLLAGKSKGG